VLAVRRSLIGVHNPSVAAVAAPMPITARSKDFNDGTVLFSFSVPRIIDLPSRGLSQLLLPPAMLAGKWDKNVSHDVVGNGDSKGRSVNGSGSEMDPSEHPRVHHLFQSG
jgi:hypothetical protein